MALRRYRRGMVVLVDLVLRLDAIVGLVVDRQGRGRSGAGRDYL